MSVTFIPTVSVLTRSPHTSMTAYLAFTRLGSKKQTGDRPVLAADPRSTWPTPGARGRAAAPDAFEHHAVAALGGDMEGLG